MKAFIKQLLGHGRLDSELEGGVLGVVKAYYGCVEAQGRGTLHCHMMIWIEGALSPTDLQNRLRSVEDPAFGARLIEYLDDVICNHIPEVPVDILDISHPIAAFAADLHPDAHREKDIHELVTKNQCHKHTETCYKYCGTGPKICRFDLDENNVVPSTTIDSDSGDLTLRISDGMVNNYNPVILEAVRCNMDIQFIGTGEEAKAIIYYITDYISKSPLKAHVAYAALEMAMRKLSSELECGEIDMSDKARRLLQRTAFSIMSNQELSAQQVASYLMDYEDHFTSHRFANLYWPSFERYVQRTMPLSSPVPDEVNGDDTSPDSADDLPADADAETSDPNATDSNVHDVSADDMDDDEVRVSTNREGEMIQLSTQLSDYLYRGEDLADMTLWDFVSLTRKIS
ncbi:hypothetical protein C2E23DRAFT_713732, partial [Lenzites betulinus]